MGKMKRNFFILLGIIILCVVGYFGYNYFFKNDSVSVKVVNEIKDYGYQLRDTDTELYKKYYNELKNVLKQKSIDEEKYASLISELFIIDFYTLNNKITNKDIGGEQFVSSLILDNFDLNASSTIYKYIESNLYGKRSQVLPIVKSVTVDSVSQESFKYNDTTDKYAYTVKLTWTYEEDLSYPTTATLVLIHEGSKLSIVELN